MKKMGYLDNIPKASQDLDKSLRDLSIMAKELKERDERIRIHYDLVAAENDILKLINKGATMHEVLNKIVEVIEYFGKSAIASILLFKDGKLWDYCSPNLPDEYIKTLAHGFPPGPNHGSCGTAAYTKEPCYIDNIATHPNWSAFPEVQAKAMEAGIVSCYSSPILGEGDSLLGTVAIYCLHPIVCRELYIRLIEWSARIAAIIIDKEENLLILHEKTEQLRGIIESQHDLIFRYSTDKRVVFANKVCQDTFGLTSRDMESPDFDFYSLIHPDDLPVATNLKNKLNISPFRAKQELRLKTPEGYRWFDWQLSAIFDLEGQIKEFQGTGRDVTEKKQSEEAMEYQCNELAKKNRILEAVITSAGSYLWLKDNKHKYSFCDKSFQEDFFSVQETNEVIGKDDIELLNTFRERLPEKRHDFGQICVSSDEHTKQIGIQCKYIEGGYIGEKLVVLEVIKTPLYDKFGSYVGNVGAAWNRSEDFKSIVRDKEELMSTGRLEILTEFDYPDTPFVWWIKHKPTHYREIVSLPIVEEASMLEPRIVPGELVDDPFDIKK